MRDLVQCDRGDQSPQAIKTRRKLTEMRLDEELRRARSFLNSGQVMALIFESDAHGSRSYLTAMLTAFDCDVDNVEESVLKVIEDAWNYFPRRFLGGRCSAEVFDELTRNNKSV